MAKGMDFFPPLVDTDLYDRVAEYWEFVEGFPLPKFEMTCVCGSIDIKVCYFAYGSRPPDERTQQGGQDQACVVMTRCITCGCNTSYNVAMSRELWNLRQDNGQPSIRHWGKALQIIHEAQGTIV